MKHLQFYLDRASSDRAARFSNFIGAQYSAVFHYGTGASGQIGNVWYSPDMGGSIFSPETTTAGVACEVAAAKYGGC